MFFKKIILLFFIFFSFADNLSKIKDSENSLKANESQTKTINKKINEIAIDIINIQNKINNSNKEIENLSQSIDKERNIIKNKQNDLILLKKQHIDLSSKENQILSTMLKILSKDLALELFLSSKDKENIDSLIASEIVRNLSVLLHKDITSLAKDYENIKKEIDNKQKLINSSEKTIQDYKNQKIKLAKLQKDQEEDLLNLKQNKNIYNNKLNDLQKENEELRNALKKLKIINNDEPKIKQFGSSYQNSIVKKYKGKKTIAPLDSFTIKQHFGNYMDPIYGIKIFNEGVVLTSKEPNAIVKNVLNGKVVFAKQTSVLNNIVIMQHENELYTIYANLSKIAPTIKVGSFVKKGYVIGRIENDLKFEISFKNYHINPLELINVN